MHDEQLIAALREAHDVDVRLPRAADVQRIAVTRRRRRRVAGTASSIIVAGALLTGALAARVGDGGTTTGTVDVGDDLTPSTSAPNTTPAPPSTEGATGVTVSPMTEGVVDVVAVDGRYVALRGDGATRRLSVSDDAVRWEPRPTEGVDLIDATSFTVAADDRLVVAGTGTAAPWVGTSTDGGATWTSVDLPLLEDGPDPYWRRRTTVTRVVPIDGGALAIGHASDSPDLRALATDQLGEDPGPVELRGHDGPLVTLRRAGDDETFVVDVTPAGPRAVELFAGSHHAVEGVPTVMWVNGPETPIVWRTADWRRWTRTTPFRGGGIRDAVAGPAGVLVTLRDTATDTDSAYRSTDGQSWEEVAPPPVAGDPVLAADADRYWAFDGTTLVSSGDGATWQTHPLPVESVATSDSFTLAAGPAGVIVAVTEDSTTASGPPPAATVLSSADGETWDVTRRVGSQTLASLVTDEELLLVTFE
jgi:hypothetical protein